MSLEYLIRFTHGLFTIPSGFSDQNLVTEMCPEACGSCHLLPPSAPLQSCACGSSTDQYSTLGNPMACFGASDLTNLERIFANFATDDATRTFYMRCSDYDADGSFRANDLTNMKMYYTGLLPVAAYFTGRRLAHRTATATLDARAPKSRDSTSGDVDAPRRPFSHGAVVWRDPGAER